MCQRVFQGGTPAASEDGTEKWVLWKKFSLKVADLKRAQNMLKTFAPTHIEMASKAVKLFRPKKLIKA